MTYDIPKLSEFVTVEEHGPNIWTLSIWTVDGDERVLFLDSVRGTVEKAAETLKDVLATWSDERYKIVRMYQDDRPSRTIKRGLTLAQAQAHCRRDDTREAGVWFDGYDHE